jgi:GTP-binding protein
MLVDMPGYGFAARSKDEVEEWHKMVETYLRSREVLTGLLLVMDVRRTWDKEEETMKHFSESLGFGMALVLTKTDKLGKNQVASAVAKIKKASGLNAVFATSALDKSGQKAVEDYIYANWIKQPRGAE